MTNDALKGLRDKIAEWRGLAVNTSSFGASNALTHNATQLESLLPQLEQAIRSEVQAAETNALRKAADSFEHLYNGDFIKKSILVLIPPASQTLLDARDAEVRLKEAEKKDAAYRERDQLVCALSKLFPSSLERHPIEDLTWENDWRWIVFIDLPTGQASWHIHDSELAFFDHLSRNQGRKWDGHTTSEKYHRLAELRAASQPTPSGEN